MNWINCTGDVVIGDHIRFERDRFTGSFRNPQYAGSEIIEADVIRDSYGRQKQQHTFTLRLTDGSQLLIKGRNVYRNGCRRLLWPDESARIIAQREKHARGDAARMARFERKLQIGETCY